VVLLNVERVGKRDAGRESIEARELKLSPCKIGERPETSNDLLYDSKDSRDMVKASFSLKHCRWLVLVDEGDFVDQKDGLSLVGEGGTNSPLSLTELSLNSLDSIFFSLIPRANEGLSLPYGLLTLPSKDPGRVFSSEVSTGAVGRLEVKGMYERKGGMVGC